MFFLYYNTIKLNNKNETIVKSILSYYRTYYLVCINDRLIPSMISFFIILLIFSLSIHVLDHGFEKLIKKKNNSYKMAAHARFLLASLNLYK